MALFTLLQQVFIVPSRMIKTIILFKDLCYLCDGYRMSAYYKPGIVLETWTQQ